MKCPFCGFYESKVIDSRPLDDNAKIKRRRECLSCNKRFTTFETIERLPVLIVKKDGKRELFDKDKIIKGLVKACEKRPVSFEIISKTAEEIENAVHNMPDNEIDSTIIGELVMDKLKNIDEVAYVRFASVYRQFSDVNTFMKELKNLLKNK